MNTAFSARMVGRLIAGIALVCAAASCQPQDGATAAQEEMDRLTQQVVEMYATGNWDMIDELLAANYVRHDPHLPVPVEDRDGLREYLAYLESAYPDMQITLDETFVAGDRTISRFTFRGTNTAPRGDLPAAGRAVEVTGATIARVVGGVIVEEWVYTDYLSTMLQLGFTLTPPAPGDLP